jgi:endonuclease YncB( thermonuclease family)
VSCTIADEGSTDEQSDKYGQFLAKVYVGDELINDWLVNEGSVRPYDGGARQLFGQSSPLSAETLPTSSTGLPLLGPPPISARFRLRSTVRR